MKICTFFFQMLNESSKKLWKIIFADIKQGLFEKKELLPFLKQNCQSWGSREEGCKFPSDESKAEPKITKQSQNIRKKPKFSITKQERYMNMKNSMLYQTAKWLIVMCIRI